MISSLFSISLLLGSSSQASSLLSDTISVTTVSTIGSAINLSSFTLSNSSWTLSSTSGEVTTQSSVTASSFWGDGSNLNTLIPQSSSPSFSGANTFNSSFTVRSGGRAIEISTGAGAQNIFISSGGMITFNPSLHNSSFTYLPEFTTTVSTFSPCITDSTITIVTSGGRIELSLTAIFLSTPSSPSGSQQYSVNFLQDGQFVNDLTAHKGVIQVGGGLQGFATPSSFQYLLPPPTPGTHSYCVALALSGQIVGGSVSIINRSGLDDAQIPHIPTGKNIFAVKEIK